MNRFQNNATFQDAIEALRATNDVQKFTHSVDLDPGAVHWYYYTQLPQNTKLHAISYDESSLYPTPYSKPNSLPFRRLRTKTRVCAVGVLPQHATVDTTLLVTTSAVTHKAVFGSAGTCICLHQDIESCGFAVVAVISGEKIIDYFPPCNEVMIAKMLDLPTPPMNKLYITNRSQYMHRTTVKAGEAVLIPAGMWHQVFNTEETLAVVDLWDYDDADTICLLRSFKIRNL